MKLFIRWNRAWRTWDVRVGENGYLIAADPTWPHALGKALSYLEVHA